MCQDSTYVVQRTRVRLQDARLGLMPLGVCISLQCLRDNKMEDNNFPRAIY